MATQRVRSLFRFILEALAKLYWPSTQKACANKYFAVCFLKTLLFSKRIRICHSESKWSESCYMIGALVYTLIYSLQFYHVKDVTKLL